MKNKVTIKDYFAGKVLQGIFANNEMWVNMCLDKREGSKNKEIDTQEDYVAQQCYIMAEAMIKESKKQLNNEINLTIKNELE